MSEFLPYQILHQQLTELALPLRIDQNTYIVFWHRNIPLGDLWLECKNNVTRMVSTGEITKAIKPALEYYTATKEEIDPIFSSLHAGNTKSLPFLLGTLIDAYKTNENIATLVSVIICTRNRPAELEQCLRSFEQFPKHLFELIVVDNDPSDSRSKNITKSFPYARYIRENRRGLDIARNTGIRHANYDIIAFTDDDVVVAKDWIDCISGAFSDPVTLAITGIVMPLELETRAQYIFEKDWSFNKGFVPRKFDHRYFLDHLEDGVPAWEIGAGANMAFRREAFELAGFFDERLDVGAAGCSGDSEMWYRIMAEGYTCRYIPQMSAYHLHRKTMKGLKSQLYNYMRGHACALRVQYENYEHAGNLLRLEQKLPLYYFQRLKQKISGHEGIHNDFIFSEILGLISGKLYYKRNADKPRQHSFQLPCLTNRSDVKNRELVSVIIPCYNHGGYLANAITSILIQTYKHYEVIVIDDGSSDDTFEVCSNYDGLVKYVRVERVGLSAARNIGILYSSGQYLVFLDADDFLYDTALEINIRYLQEDKSLALVSGGHKRLNDKLEMLPGVVAKNLSGENYAYLLKGNYIAMEGAVMYRRELFPKFHFDTRLRACEDYDLNMRIARFYPILGHENCVAAYMIRGNSMSSDPIVMLHNAEKVLWKQSRCLWDTTEREAYNNGLTNWNDYYDPLILEKNNSLTIASATDEISGRERIPISPPIISALPFDIQRSEWSVMIPAYNCGKYLRQAIESVLAQDIGIEKMQIEVVDDCSTDINVQQLVETIGKGRVLYFRQPTNVGSLRNFETCINRATGKYVHLLHGDDYIDVDFYGEIEMMFGKYPEAGAACTGFTQVTGENKFISNSNILEGEPRILQDWFSIIATKQQLQTPAVVVKREVYEKLGSFFGVHYGEDWEMWVRIAANYPVVLSPRKLAHYRVHDSNISSNYFSTGQNIRDIRAVLETIKSHLPADKRSRINRLSRKHWSAYFAHATDLTYGRYRLPQQALKQAIEAFKLYPGTAAIFYLIKTYIKVKIRWRKY